MSSTEEDQRRRRYGEEEVREWFAHLFSVGLVRLHDIYRVARLRAPGLDMSVWRIDYAGQLPGSTFAFDHTLLVYEGTDDGRLHFVEYEHNDDNPTPRGQHTSAPCSTSA